MVDFNDYDYSSLDPTSKIGRLAARSDKNGSGKIDNEDEKSLFLRGANNLVKDNKLTKEKFHEIFGFEYGENPGDKGKPEPASASKLAEVESYGADIVDKLYMHMNTEDDYEEADFILSQIDRTTAFDFMKGVYSKDTNEGFIEMLDDEWGADEIITMDTKIKFIESFIQQAKDLGIGVKDQNKDIKKLEEILKKYKVGGANSDADNFNENHAYDYEEGAYSAAGVGVAGAVIGAKYGAGVGAAATSWGGGWWGAAIGAVVGAVGGAVGALADQTTDNERIDKHMKSLYRTMERVMDKKETEGDE